MDNLRILHYSFGLPPKSTGGLPLYVGDLVNAQKEAGYNVDILLPKQQLFGKDKIIKKGNVYYLENSLPISSIFGIKEPKKFIRPYNKNVIEKFLNQLEPTVIHIHTFMGLPKEFLEIAKFKNIKLIYTTHDYYGLCLKCNFIDSAGCVCENYNPEKCAKCNLINGLSTKMCYLIGTNLYKVIKKNKFVNQFKSKYRDNKVEVGLNANESKINTKNYISEYTKLLEYYDSMFSMIDIFHFNSELTKQTYLSYMPRIYGEVIPLTLSSIKDQRKERKRKYNKILTIGYIGRKEPYKGIDLLIDALFKLNKENLDFKCLLYGDDFKKYDLLIDGKVKNMGTYSNREKKHVFNSMDLLIIPSICKETFGFIALEALSYGVPVFFSKNVGSKDLISKIEPDYIFNNNHIFEVLSYVIQNPTILSEYSNIIDNIFTLYRMDEHIQNIYNLYK